jgi:hypothetical protein
VTGSFEYGNEPSGSIKGEEFLDQLSNYLLLKKDSAQWRQLRCFLSSRDLLKKHIFIENVTKQHITIKIITYLCLINICFAALCRRTCTQQTTDE